MRPRRDGVKNWSALLQASMVRVGQAFQPDSFQWLHVRLESLTYVLRRRVYLSRIALAALEVSATAPLGGGVLLLPGFGPSPSMAGRSMTVEPVGIPSLSTGLPMPVSSPPATSKSKAAADSSSTLSEAGGLTVSTGPGFAAALDSMRTKNESGPMSKRSSFFSSLSPLTGTLFTIVPLVLSKSRMNTLSPRTKSAQWRLLIMLL